MSKKYVYMFSEGDASMKNLLGGKGSNLAEMTKMGLPIPQGFIVSTEACTDYNAGGKILTVDMKSQIDECLANLEKIADKKFGDNSNPLLVSVRSGARASCLDRGSPCRPAPARRAGWLPTRRATTSQRRGR